MHLRLVAGNARIVGEHAAHRCGSGVLVTSATPGRQRCSGTPGVELRTGEGQAFGL